MADVDDNVYADNDVDANDDDVQKTAIADENVQRFIAGKTIRKAIVVPGRLVNVVV